MTRITFKEQDFELENHQSVLDCLTGNGVPIPFSCRNGVCHTCLMLASSGPPHSEAQRGLKESQKLQNYFLPCICYPKHDMSVELPNEPQSRTSATVRTLKPLNPETILVGLEAHDPIEYRPGQFITLIREPELARNYSIASVPAEDEQILLHVRRLPQGRMSRWIHDELQVGQTIQIGEPTGDCFYVPGNPDQGMILIGTGSGLAPLYGIVRDALRQGHTGPIRLFHGSRDETGLYLTAELRDLAKQYENFEYTPCLSGEGVSSGYKAGRAHDIAFRETGNFKDWRVFLCGHPEMVRTARKQAFLAGASLNDILADAFHLSN